MSAGDLVDFDDPIRPHFGRGSGGIDRGAPRRGRFRRQGPKATQPRARVAVPEPLERHRRCTIKTKYISTRPDGGEAARDHLAYLVRDGVEQDGSRGRLFGADETFDAEPFRRPLEGEERQFRFIVSPEDGDAVDLKEFARRLMSQVEKDLGRRLIWAGVNHHNTKKPHAHIVVRGVDRDGEDLRIDRSYIGYGMRWRAQELLTRELGPRLEFEYSASRLDDIDADRLTEIDRILAEHVQPDGSVTQKALLAGRKQEGRNCIARLRRLRQFDLAAQKPPGNWRLADGWMETLERMGEQRDRTERLYPIVGPSADEYQVVDSRSPISGFEGVVLGKGLHDELSGQMFAAIKTPEGKGFYVLVRPEAANLLPIGKTARVEFITEPWVKPADRIISRFVQENGGLYDPPRHQRELESLPRTGSSAQKPSPSDRVEANIRRLERLEKYGLARQLNDGRWQVAANLIPELEKREQNHPTRLLRVDPVHPVDRQLPAAPATAREMEVAEIGKVQAQQSGLTYVANPARFRGRLFPCGSAPSGAEYLRVVDEARRQFTIVPKPPNAERMRGHIVSVSRGPDGKPFLPLGPEISR